MSIQEEQPDAEALCSRCAEISCFDYFLGNSHNLCAKLNRTHLPKGPGMAELLTSSEMRALEHAAIETAEVSGLELMERAGRGVVDAIFSSWPKIADRVGNAGRTLRAVVLCGPGNNGGDGFVVARLLHERGWEVDVFLFGDSEKLPPDAKVNFERWSELGSVNGFAPGVEPSRPNATLVIDALFGIGLIRPISDPALRHTLGDVNGSCKRHDRAPVPEQDDRGPFVVSIDIPSGLNADTGNVLEFEPPERCEHQIEAGYVRADLTVTFHAAKLGHVLAEGPDLCGKLVVVDIGL